MSSDAGPVIGRSLTLVTSARYKALRALRDPAAWTFDAGGGARCSGRSRRRLGGIGLGYLFLDASHFKYHVGAAAKLVLAAWASTPAASPCSSAWTPQRPGPGTPGPGSGRPRRAQPGLPLLLTAQAGHGQDGGRDMVLSAGAALPEIGDVRNGWSVVDQFTYLDEAVGR
jgi:hypothetical protein